MVAPIIPVLLAAHKIYKGFKVAKKITPAVKAYIKKKKKLSLQESKIKSKRTARYGEDTPLFRKYTRQTFGPKKKPMGKKGLEKLKQDRAKIEKKTGITSSEPLTQSRFAYYHGYRNIVKRDPYTGREVVNKIEKATKPTSSVNFGGSQSLFGGNKGMTEFVRNYRALEKMQRQTYKRNLNIKKVESLKRMADSKKTKWLNKPSNYLNK